MRRNNNQARGRRRNRNTEARMIRQAFDGANRNEDWEVVLPPPQSKETPILIGRGPTRRRNKNKKKKPQTIGGVFGKGVDTLIKTLVGFGDYTVEGNSILKGGMDPPEIVNSVNRGGFIVRHREYLGDITASTNFDIQTYYINPGQLATFPWLSTVAANFEQYRIRGMVFEFKSLSSDSILSTATSSALGSVIMATQYDVLDNVFASKFEMENYQFASSSKPSLSFLHPIECKRNQTTITELYIRTGAPPSNSDQRLYDLGKFSIATVGMQAASGVAGELWLTYEIELFKPKLIEDLGSILLMDHWVISTVSGTFPLGTISTRELTTDSNLGTEIVSDALQFPGFVQTGTYLLIYYVVGTSATINPAAPTLTDCQAVVAWDNQTSMLAQAPLTGTTNTTLLQATYLQITGSGAAYFIPNTGTIPTAAVADLYVIQVNQASIPNLARLGLKPQILKQLESDSE